MMITKTKQNDLLKNGSNLFQAESKKDKQIKNLKYLVLIILTNIITYQVSSLFISPSPQQEVKETSLTPKGFKRMSLIGKIYVPENEIRNETLSITAQGRTLSKKVFVREISRYDQIGEGQIYRLTVDIPESDVEIVVTHTDSLSFVPHTNKKLPQKGLPNEIIF